MPNARKTGDTNSLHNHIKILRTPEGVGYARIDFSTHSETWRVTSDEFRHAIAHKERELSGSSPSRHDVEKLAQWFEAESRFAEVGPVHLRVAPRGRSIYLDLANEEWKAVRIQGGSWKIVKPRQVTFTRTRGMKSLPNPVRGGSVDELRDFLNIGSSDDWHLIVGWLLACFRPRGPYPVLALHGEQGAAKSTTASVLRALIDPNHASTRAQPRSDRDLMIAAHNSWLLSYDNLSFVPPWLSDALCQISTGGGYATRQLYTDTDEVVMAVQRPIILNGIEEVVTRGDLMDRSIVVYLPTISGADRRTESEFWDAFEEARPRILGALLDVVAAAAEAVDDVALDDLPRMADFVQWVTASEEALHWKVGRFADAYRRSRAASSEVILEASPIGRALLHLLTQGTFSGTSQELLARLSRLSPNSATRRGWPQNPLALTKALRRIAPALRSVGVEYETRQTSGSGSKKLITLRPMERHASVHKKRR